MSRLSERRTVPNPFLRHTAEQRKQALFKTLLHNLMTAKRRLPAEFIARFAEGTGHE